MGLTVHSVGCRSPDRRGGWGTHLAGRASFSSYLCLLGRRVGLRCRLRNLPKGDVSRAETAPELTHSGPADDEDQGSTRECGDQQGDDDGHVPGYREEFNADGPGVLGQEIDQGDAQRYADEQCGPRPADPGGKYA